MNVLGISGLDYSEKFKSENIPGLLRQQRRIVQGLDSAAALVTPRGVRAAAAQERFSREKGTGSFPVGAINYCLEQARLSYADIDYIAHGFSYEPYREWFEKAGGFTRRLFSEVYSNEALRGAIKKKIPSAEWDKKIVPVEHHIAHAASAFYMSGFGESLILVADGMGEIHSTTTAVGERDKITIVDQVVAPNSLGILYGVFSLYLGFCMNQDEYKVMGLASHGDLAKHFHTVLDLVCLNSDGTYTVPILSKNSGLFEKETYEGTIRSIESVLGPRRAPDAAITHHHQDVAAAVQAVLQVVLMHILRRAKEKTGQQRLCLAGGVALNCTANGFIKRSRLFRDVFVQPAAGDDGTALGAALYAYRSLGGNNVKLARRMGPPYWGPAYKRDSIATVLRDYPQCDAIIYSCFQDFQELATEVARRIAKGHIVGWYQGRMEFGPRALGNRSILADPRSPDMRRRLNSVTKKREEFRPFAPAVAAECATRYFEIESGDEAAYSHMLFVAPVRPEYQSVLPAVTHVDGSARVQTVSRDDNLRFWTLLNEFGLITDVPVLLNTSFNIRGQPIVCSPVEALETYLATDLDLLVLGDYLVVRSGGELYA